MSKFNLQAAWDRAVNGLDHLGIQQDVFDAIEHIRALEAEKIFHRRADHSTCWDVNRQAEARGAVLREALTKCQASSHSGGVVYAIARNALAIEDQAAEMLLARVKELETEFAGDRFLSKMIRAQKDRDRLKKKLDLAVDALQWIDGTHPSEPGTECSSPRQEARAALARIKET